MKKRILLLLGLSLLLVPNTQLHAVNWRYLVPVLVGGVVGVCVWKFNKNADTKKKALYAGEEAVRRIESDFNAYLTFQGKESVDQFVQAMQTREPTGLRFAIIKNKLEIFLGRAEEIGAGKLTGSILRCLNALPGCFYSDFNW